MSSDVDPATMKYQSLIKRMKGDPDVKAMLRRLKERDDAKRAVEEITQTKPPPNDDE